MVMAVDNTLSLLPDATKVSLCVCVNCRKTPEDRVVACTPSVSLDVPARCSAPLGCTSMPPSRSATGRSRLAAIRACSVAPTHARRVHSAVARTTRTTTSTTTGCGVKRSAAASRRSSERRYRWSWRSSAATTTSTTTTTRRSAPPANPSR